MPRPRQVQRTIKCTSVTFAAFNTETHEIETVTLTVAGLFSKDYRGQAKLEKELTKLISSKYKLLEITDSQTVVQHYTMPESDYLMYATLIP